MVRFRLFIFAGAEFIVTRSLRTVVEEQLGKRDKEALAWLLIAGSITSAGAVFMFFMWDFFRDSDSTFAKEAIKYGSSITMIGSSGYFATEFFAQRKRNSGARALLDAHEVEAGPPPSELFAEIEKQLVSWLKR